MSNEELAVLAYAGDNIAIGELYQSCYQFIYKTANSYYVLHQNRLKACGVQFEDMLNEAYFAIPEAVKAFNEQETQYKFMTFLSYPLLNCFNKLAGLRTRQSRKEPLNAYTSLDTPISDTDDLTIGDTIMDKTLPTEEDITEGIVFEKVFQAAAQVLTDTEYQVIENRFKYNKTYAEIAMQNKCSPNNIREHQKHALLKLRLSRRMRELSTDIIDATYHLGGFGIFANTHTSSTEWAVLKMEKKR